MKNTNSESEKKLTDLLNSEKQKCNNFANQCKLMQ